jgi:hypothetical protein
MIKILYIPEGIYMTFENNNIDYSSINVNIEYNEGPEKYILQVIHSCNEYPLAHIWGLPKNTKFLRSEFEIIYD